MIIEVDFSNLPGHIRVEIDTGQTLRFCQRHFFGYYVVATAGLPGQRPSVAKFLAEGNQITEDTQLCSHFGYAATRISPCEPDQATCSLCATDRAAATAQTAAK